MSIYGAIDVSMKECHLCLMNSNRSIVFEACVESTPQAIDQCLREADVKPDAVEQIVIESGRGVPFIFHGLRDLGWSLLGVDSVHAHALLKSKRLHKTDKNDARGLAEFALAGAHRAIHIKSLDAHALRAQLCAREKLLKCRVGLENNIRALCSTFGIVIGAKSGKAFEAAAKDALRIDGLAQSVAALMQARAAMIAQISELTKQLRTIASSRCETKRLMEIPGVGPLTALCFIATLDDLSRFKKARDVGVFLGLVPKRHQSGSVDYTSGITKRGDGRLKRLLYEAANSILVRSKIDTSLQRWAKRIAQRKGLKKARIALARKLSIVMQAMVVDGTFFDPFPNKATSHGH